MFHFGQLCGLNEKKNSFLIKWPKNAKYGTKSLEKNYDLGFHF